MAMLPGNTQTFLEEQLESLEHADSCISAGLDHLKYMKQRSDGMIPFMVVEKDIVSKTLHDAVMLEDEIARLRSFYKNLLDTLDQPMVYASPESFRFRSTEE